MNKPLEQYDNQFRDQLCGGNLWDKLKSKIDDEIIYLLEIQLFTQLWDQLGDQFESGLCE